MSVKQSREHKKPRRLKGFSYLGNYRYFITIRSHCFKPHFKHDEVVVKVIEILKSVAEKESFAVWAYCFMPDHLHLLIEGKKGDANMKSFVALFKQKSSYWFRSVYREKVWEPNYYERVLRNDEAIPAIAQYIFGNPVRKGLVEDYSSYPYSGSFELEDIRNL